MFVHYAEDYTINDEWVYNAADIQAAKIVFAHDLGRRRTANSSPAILVDLFGL